MKLTLNWLKEFVDIPISAEELADKLDLSGTAVESLVHLGAKYDKVVVGEIVSVKKHPNADRLNFCEVNLSEERTGIVCGAPNVAVGQKVPVATSGTILPNGVRIKPTKIRGVESNGMICSEVELGLSDEASGIMVLPPDAEAGQPLSQALGLDDWVFELEITPNRPDCMGVIGVAREVAALLGTKMRLPAIDPTEGEENIANKAKIDIVDAGLCPRYTARYVDNIIVGPSPAWLRQRLESVGVRSINNIVDVTNFVMFETGQPLHAFDFKLLRGGRIIVRRAGDREELETIDHVVRKLNPEMLVIADADRPVALAGVMGGFDSEINDDTTEVLIESAGFSAVNIRKTSRSLGLISESSLRFEKGVDIGGTLYAADRAAQLIADVGGGRVWAGVIDNYPAPKSLPKITMRPEQTNKILGTDLSLEKIVGVLESLELQVTANKTPIEVTIPSFRVDLEREIDLIEEVARLYGLNNIESALLSSSSSDRGLSPLQTLTRNLRDLMSAAGLTEVVNYSFIGQAELERLALPADHPWMAAVPITNPLSEDQALLRTTLLTSLMRTISHNYNRDQTNLAIFEIGNVFSHNDGLPQQQLMLAGAVTGNRHNQMWYEQGIAETDFFDIKGMVDLIRRRTSPADCYIEPIDAPFLQPGQSAELAAGKEVIGFFGTLHPKIQENYGLRQPVYIFQLDIRKILSHSQPNRKFAEIPRYPAIVLDLALIVEESVSWKRLRQLVLQTGAPLLREVRLFDLYRGSGVPAGKKSLAISLVYQAADRTLTDNEAGRIQERLIKRAGKELGAQLRE